jgi:dihydroorotase
MSLLIKNSRILEKGRLVRKNIFIENSKILKISNKKIDSNETVDAKNKIVLPGLIDPHVHFREPGLTQKEDFFAGSKAAAAGGITCFLDMPNTNPPTVSVDLLEEKRNLAKNKSLTNFGFHFGSTKKNVEEIKKAKNIASVKIFLNISTGKMLIDDDKVLRRIMEVSKINTIHAEGENVRKATDIAKSLGKKFYLCHVTLAKELDYIKNNKKQNVWVEVTPHHLFLTEKHSNNFIRMKPSLGKDKDRQALWNALVDGTIDTLGSDHAPHTIEEKESDNPPYGVPGVETSLPLMLDAVNKRRITLQRLVEITSENPAKIFKIKNKGFIKEGYDGDLTIVDMKLRKKVKNDELFTKCGWSPFEGWRLRGWPIMTIVNGNVVFDNGEIYDKFKGKEVIFYG